MRLGRKFCHCRIRIQLPVGVFPLRIIPEKSSFGGITQPLSAFIRKRCIVLNSFGKNLYLSEMIRFATALCIGVMVFLPSVSFAGNSPGETIARAMFQMEGGAWVLDTPGMRELRLGENTHGLKEVFSDIEELAKGCQYRDCDHEGTSGCAVLAAIESDALEAAVHSFFRPRL